MSRFLALSDQLNSATSTEDSWNALTNEMSKVGLASAKYGFAPIVSETEKPDVLFLGGHGHTEFEGLYDSGSFAQHDLTVQHCIQKTTPMSWADVRYLLDADEQVSEQSKHVHNTSFEFGMHNGVVIPLRDFNPLSRGGLTFQGDPYEDQSSFERFLTEKLPDLQLMAEVFHANLQRKYILSSDQHLSSRQKECLLWAIYGLRTQQIAARMGTHPKTVEKQLSDIRKKLRAKTTTQAAVTAYMLGLIDP